MQFETALQVLCDAAVEFVVIGGLSATLHGSARITYDLDICYSRATSNLHRLCGALAPYHPRQRGIPAGLPFVWDSGTLRDSTILPLQSDLGEIDLLAEVAGLGSYDDVLKHSIPVEAFDRYFMTLDLRGLIRSKKAAGREKDLASLAELESLLDAES